MISDAIKLATGTVELLKAAKDANLDAAELKDKLADAIVNIADLKIALVDRDAEIRRLEGIISSTGDYVRRDGFKFRKGQDGAAVGYAFCPGCEANSGKMVMLVDEPFDAGLVICPSCNKVFGKPKATIGYTASSQMSVQGETDFDVFDI